MKIPKPVENYSDNQGKEQPDKKSRLFVGAMRKTVGLSYKAKLSSMCQ